MKRNGKTVHLPCDPGLGCTFPNCDCHDLCYSTSKITKLQALGLTLIILSGLIVIGVVTLLIAFWDDISLLVTAFFSVALNDKALGNTVCVILLLIVSYNVYQYAKRGNF